MGDKLPEEVLRERVLTYLGGHNTMTLATLQEGKPWAATVFYVNHGFIFYFLSDPTVAEHCKNIAANPRVSATVDEDYPLVKLDDWRKVKGVQLEGVAEILTTEADIARAAEAYVEKYPFVARYLKLIASPFPRVVSLLERFAQRLPLGLDFAPVSQVKFYRLVAQRVWFVDNERSFERREEVRL